MNIIIGNNSAILRNILSDMLKENGFNILASTSNGDEIFEIVQTMNVDAIILGDNISGMSEKELIEKIKTPVIILSDNPKVKDLPVSKILPKPQIDMVESSDFKNSLFTQLNRHQKNSKQSNNLISRVSVKPTKVEHIVIGSSTGGPNALKEILKEIPADFPIPISIVQHLEQGHEENLASWLDKFCKLHVRVAKDGDIPQKGEVIMGVQGRHLSLVNKMFKFTDEAQLHFQKPAVDILFSTAANSFKSNLVGILLTGMGRDGGNGCLDIVRNGGFTIVQDEKTSTVYGMPKAAVELNAASVVLPLNEIANYLIEMVRSL